MKKIQKILIHKDDILKYINKDDLLTFINNGWKKGISDKHRLKMTKIPHTAPGKCLDPIKELQRREKISNSMKGNTNWMYNKRRGNGKLGWYNNIYFDSAWELAFYIYYKEHNMYIERNYISYTYIFENSQHKYTPDFITDEGIIEVKGRKNKKSLAKELQFPDIIVYDKFKMKYILLYIINKYGDEFYNNFFDRLYIKPKRKNYYKLKNKINKEKQKLERSLKKELKKQLNKELKKQLIEKRKNIICNLYNNSSIDFSKYGWVTEAKKYLKDRNELWDVNLHKCIKKVYPEFFDLPNVFIRKNNKI